MSTHDTRTTRQSTSLETARINSLPYRAPTDFHNFTTKIIWYETRLLSRRLGLCHHFWVVTKVAITQMVFMPMRLHLARLSCITRTMPTNQANWEVSTINKISCQRTTVDQLSATQIESLLVMFLAKTSLVTTPYPMGKWSTRIPCLPTQRFPKECYRTRMGSYCLLKASSLNNQA